VLTELSPRSGPKPYTRSAECIDGWWRSFIDAADSVSFAGGICSLTGAGGGGRIVNDASSRSGISNWPASGRDLSPPSSTRDASKPANGSKTTVHSRDQTGAKLYIQGCTTEVLRRHHRCAGWDCANAWFEMGNCVCSPLPTERSISERSEDIG